MSLDHYDAIVIGSGAGGSATAYRLALGGLRVALLEKGGHLPKDGSTLDVTQVVHQGAFLSKEPWLDGGGNPITPEEHFNVGGKTKWYGAALLRFAGNEFLPDPEHGCPGWPLAAQELSPFYAEAERLLGVRHLMYERDLERIVARLRVADSSWLAEGMPMGLAAEIEADRREAAHFDGFASAKGLKGEADRSLLSLLSSRSDFHLLVNAPVERLIGTHTTVTGVRLADGRELTAPRIFLAAGALHSPRLLSSYLTHSGLSTTLPIAAHVGRNLKLHLLTAMVALSPGRKRDLIRKTAVLTHARYPHSSVQPLGFDGELIATLMPKWLPGSLRRALGTRAYGFFLQTEDGSDARNRVTQDADGTRPPVLDYDDARLPAASREHRSFTRAFQRGLARAGMVSFVRRIGLNGTAHACGSLVCGHSSADSVVDARGRVHGMQGLYVVDGSVLPRSSRVNPSLTIYAWGLRVGDLVAREFQGSVAGATQEAGHVV
jgi:choline dehydrogenase-like flavoprotein